MEEKEDTGDTSLSVTDYLTRSSAKQSDGHRQMVNFLEKLSRDENGTPVDWSFVKSKRVKGKTKKITSFKKNVGYAPWLKKVLGARKTRKETRESQKKIRTQIVKKKRKMSEKHSNMTDVNESGQPFNVVKKKRGRPKKQIDPESLSLYPQSRVDSAREVTDELHIKGPTGHIILTTKQEGLLTDHKYLKPDEAGSFDNLQKPSKKKFKNLWKNGKTSQAAKKYAMKKKLLCLAKEPDTLVGDNQELQNSKPLQKKRIGRPPKHLSKPMPTVGMTGMSAVEIVRRNKKIKKLKIKQNLIEDKVKSIKPKVDFAENVENYNFLPEHAHINDCTEKKFESSNVTLGPATVSEQSLQAKSTHILPCEFTKVDKKNKEDVMGKKQRPGNKTKATQSLPKLKKFEVEEIFKSSIIQQVFSGNKQPSVNIKTSFDKEKRKPGRPRKSISNEINDFALKYEDTINKVASGSAETLTMDITNPVQTVVKKKIGRPPKMKMNEDSHQIPISEQEYNKKSLVKKKMVKQSKKLNLSTNNSSFDNDSCEMLSEFKDQMPVLTLSEVFYINDGKRKPGRPQKRKSLPVLHREPSLNRPETPSAGSSLNLNDTFGDSTKVGMLPSRLSVSSDRTATSRRTEVPFSDIIKKYESVINMVVEESRKFESEKSKSVVGKVGKSKKISKKLSILPLGSRYTLLAKKKNGPNQKSVAKLKYHQDTLENSELKLVQRKKISKLPKPMFQYKKSLERAKAYTTVLHDGVAERKSVFSVNVSKQKKSYNKKGPLKLLRSQMMVTRKGKEIKHLSGKKRKRTLSGEFDLLDEVTLRKQVRRCTVTGDPDCDNKKSLMEQDMTPHIRDKDTCRYNAIEGVSLKHKTMTNGKRKLQTTPEYLSEAKKVEPHPLYHKGSILGNFNNTSLLEKTSFHIPGKYKRNRNRGKGHGRLGFFRLPRKQGCSIRSIHEKIFQNAESTSLEFGEQNTAHGLLNLANEATMMLEKADVHSDQTESEMGRCPRGRGLRSRLYHMITQKGRIKQTLSKSDILHEDVQSWGSMTDSRGADNTHTFDMPNAVKNNIPVVANVAPRRKRGRPSSKRFGHQRFLHDDQNASPGVTCTNSATSTRGNYMHRGRLKFLSSRSLHQNDNDINVKSEIESEIVGQNFAKRISDRGRVTKIKKKVKKHVLHEELTMQNLSEGCVFEVETSMGIFQSKKAADQQFEDVSMHNADNLTKIADISPGGVQKSRRRRGLVLKTCTVVRSPNGSSDKYRRPQRARRGWPRKRSQAFPKPTSSKTDICESSALSVFQSDIKNILDNVINIIVDAFEVDRVHMCKESEDGTKCLHSDVGDDRAEVALEHLSSVLPVDGKSEVKLEQMTAVASAANNIDHSYFQVEVIKKSPKLTQPCTSAVTDNEMEKIVRNVLEQIVIDLIEKEKLEDGVGLIRINDADNTIPHLGIANRMYARSLEKESNRSKPSDKNSVLADSAIVQPIRENSEYEVQFGKNENIFDMKSSPEDEHLSKEKDESSLVHLISDHKEGTNIMEPAAKISFLNNKSKGTIKGKLNGSLEMSANKEMGNVDDCLEVHLKEIEEKYADEQNNLSEMSTVVPTAKCLSEISESIVEVCSLSPAKADLLGKQTLAAQEEDKIVDAIASHEATDSTTRSTLEHEKTFIKDDKIQTGRRVFELRQKVSRSPLEIIAMKQTLEEERYFMEKFQKSQQKASKLERLKEQKSLHISGDGMKKGSKTTQSSEKDLKTNNIAEMMRQCFPCSVVLSDFVKQLKLLALQTRIDDEQDEGSIQDDSSGVSYEMELAEESTSSGSPLGDIENESVIGHENALQKTRDGVNTLDSPRKPLPPLKLKLKLDISKSKKHHRRKRRGQRMVYQVASTTTEEISGSHDAEKETDIDSDKKNVTDEEPAAIDKHETYIRKLESTESKGFESSFLQFIKEKNLPRKTLAENTMVSQTMENICENKLDNYDQTSMASESATQEKVDISVQEKSQFLTITENGEDSPLDMLFKKEVPSEQKSLPMAKQFHCKSCNIVTQSKAEIESHVYKHLSNIPFRCGHCHRVFPSRGMAFLHSRSSHSDKETKVEKVGTVKESDHYTVMEAKPKDPSGEAVIHTNLGQVQKSSEPVIISVVLPQNVHESVDRYCCSFCKFSSSSKDCILEHVNAVHKHETTYTCSVCNKTIFRYQESVAEHFERNHPHQQVTYKCTPDFYDVQQSSDRTSQDKGNIFDRMNELFDGNKGNLSVETGMRRSFSEKTSAEADSTTKEPDVEEIDNDSAMLLSAQENLPKSPMPMVPVTRLDRATSPGSNFTSVPSSFGMQTDVAIQSDNTLSSFSHGAVAHKSNELKSSCLSNAPDTQPTVIMLDDDKETESDGVNMELKIVDVVSLKEPVRVSPLVIPSVSKPHPAKHVASTLKEILLYQGNNPPKSGSLERVGTTYKCETCNIHVPVLQVMLEHLKKHHNIQSKLFQCPYCKQVSADMESDVIKHIQTSHPLQDSTVVSLSSPAKEHLKLLVIPVGDANKVGDRFLIEKDIYQCLKCQKHMPSLDFIYDHLEKEHNEVFVYVCPYCKKFKGKEEKLVFDHIRIDHNKSTSDIMLSLAIEENLFIRVPSLTRDKAYHRHRLLQKSVSGTNTRKQMTPRSLARLQSESGVGQTHSNPTENISDDDIILISEGPRAQGKPSPEERIPLPYQPPASGLLQNRSMQLAYATATTWYPPPAHQVQNIRSGISFHRPTIIRSQNPGLQTKSNVGQTQALEMVCASVDADAYSIPNMVENSEIILVDPAVKSSTTSAVPEQTLQGSSHSVQSPLNEQVSRIQGGPPPPLVRGPPPLIRYDHVEKLEESAVNIGSNQTHIHKSNVMEQPISTVTSGSHSSAAIEEDRAVPPVRNMSFSMTDKLHRLHSSATSGSPAPQQQTPPPSDVIGASTARPVLKIPSIPPSLRCRTYQQHPADVNKQTQMTLFSGSQRMQDAVQKHKSVGSPLDLSKQLTSCSGQSPNSYAQQLSSTSQNRIPEDTDDMPPDAFKIFNLAPSQTSMQSRPPPYPGIQSPLQELQRQVRAGFRQDIGRQIGVGQMSYNQRPVAIGRSSLFPTSVQTSMRMNIPLGLQQRRALTTDGQRPMNQTNIPNRPMMNFTSMHMFKCPYCPSIVPLRMGDVAPHIEKFHPGSSIVFVSIDR